MSFFSDTYRFLPAFKGKKRLGAVLFKNAIHKKSNQIIAGKRGLKYAILNTHDSVGRDLFYDGIYEPHTIESIERNLADGDVMIDVGANIGAICLPVAKSNNIKVFAFEPGPHIFEVLQKNIQINEVQNIQAIPLALSDQSGTVDFYESDRVHGWSGIVKIDSFEHSKVEATTLDDFATENHIDRIAVLKVDVQGWEYHVFTGAEKLLKQKKITTIIFEFEWWAEENAGLKIGRAQEYLLEQGYRLQTLEGIQITSPITSGTTLIQANF